jgi:hypothetical protein
VIASEDEWYKAAYYNPTLNNGNGGYTDYPWANGAYPSHEPDAVNGANFDGESGPMDVGSYIYATSYLMLRRRERRSPDRCDDAKRRRFREAQKQEARRFAPRRSGRNAAAPAVPAGSGFA